MRTKILVLYPYYWPFYKAGGPVQSLFNLVCTFKNEAQFYLVSKHHDIDKSLPDQPVEINQWNCGIYGEKIFYTERISLALIYRLFKELKPQAVLINGMFNVSTTVPGVLCSWWFDRRMIISPRGMLQQWGLKRGKIKKLVFLKLLKFVLPRTAEWHATDEQEKIAILKIFGANQVVHLAPNIPRKISELKHIPFPDKNNNKIKLVFLSLINPNKNLHLIIDSVKNNVKFDLDIYGPVANESYWKICRQKMEGIPYIRYLGAVPPWNISEILKKYHFFVLPTQGENFGHAIFDSLSSSVPVIISRQTPWRGIDKEGAGFYVDSNNTRDLDSVLKYISSLNDRDYQIYRASAHNYAKRFWIAKNYLNDYRFLLGS